MYKQKVQPTTTATSYASILNLILILKKFDNYWYKYSPIFDSSNLIKIFYAPIIAL